MPRIAREWTMKEAEKQLPELLNKAKTVGVQRIVDRDDTFELVFIQREKKKPIGEFFASPGPDVDGDL
ncbi:hypothetical protein C8J35_11611 [Rhizobium sp. PP-F2F-G38]|nr:hypothetical protein C8J35_11611 [Rhizobium sp. PP-F2F-G38]